MRVTISFLSFPKNHHVWCNISAESGATAAATSAAGLGTPAAARQRRPSQRSTFPRLARHRGRAHTRSRKRTNYVIPFKAIPIQCDRSNPLKAIKHWVTGRTCDRCQTEFFLWARIFSATVANRVEKRKNQLIIRSKVSYLNYVLVNNVF